MENLSSKSKLPYIERYNEAKKEYDETILKLKELMKKANKDKKEGKDESNEVDSVSLSLSELEHANKKQREKLKLKKKKKRRW